MDDAVPFVSRIFDEISNLHPDKKIVIGETGYYESHNKANKQN